jgi:6-phosphogluconolactonase (cycloisomerase 2 family)
MKVRILWASLSLLLLIGGLTGCISSNKQFAYATGPSSAEVFQFKIHSNGSLMPLNPANAAVGSGPTSVVVRPAGDFVYITNSAGNNVTLLSINRGNGQVTVPASTSPIPSPTPSNIFNTGTTPIAAAASPAGPFLYVLNQGSGNISAFNIDPKNGNLGVVSPPGFFGSFTPGAATSIAITPKGNFLYVASPLQNAIFCFSIDTSTGSSAGRLTEIQVAGGPCFVSLTFGHPTFVAVEPTGRFLYAADPSGNQVLAFSIQSDGTLKAVSGTPALTGNQPVSIATDSQGTFLYVANQGSNSVSAFLIDSSTGALAAVSGSPFPTGGRGPTFVTASGAFVYVTEQITNDIAAFAIGSNGALTPVPGSPFNVPTSAQWVALTKE